MAVMRPKSRRLDFGLPCANSKSQNARHRKFRQAPAAILLETIASDHP